MRGFTPRWQSTTLPLTALDSEPAKQRSASATGTPAAAASAASIMSVAGRPPVTDAPVTWKAGPVGGVIVALLSTARAGMSAPTEFSHGTVVGLPTVDGSGPSLPAEFATNTPASEAPRKANETGSMRSDVVPPTE